MGGFKQMKYNVIYSNQFKKDYKLILKQGKMDTKLREIVALLANGEVLPPQCKDHALYGEYIGCRECHIEPDWLLIYRIDKQMVVLALMRTGSHSQLF
jgi:mRNA interferase YafQ